MEKGSASTTTEAHQRTIPYYLTPLSFILPHLFPRKHANIQINARLLQQNTRRAYCQTKFVFMPQRGARGRAGRAGAETGRGWGQPTVWLSHLSVATPTTLTKISFLSRGNFMTTTMTMAMAKRYHNNFVISLKSGVESERESVEGEQQKELKSDQNYIWVQ